jgi:hypothetical protein
MPFGVNFGYGIQRVIDAQQRFLRAGHPVYLRLKNFADTQQQEWSQLGFQITPSGGQVGTTDVLIAPPPQVEMVSMHNIGMSNGKLMMGARYFVISASFVDAQQAAMSVATQDLVWDSPLVLGLVTDGRLFSIEDRQHKEVAGKTVIWILTCNEVRN